MPSKADIEYLERTKEKRSAYMKDYFQSVRKPKIQAERAKKKKQQEVTFTY